MVRSYTGSGSGHLFGALMVVFSTKKTFRLGSDSSNRVIGRPSRLVLLPLLPPQCDRQSFHIIRKHRAPSRISRRPSWYQLEAAWSNSKPAVVSRLTPQIEQTVGQPASSTLKDRGRETGITSDKIRKK